MKKLFAWMNLKKLVIGCIITSFASCGGSGGDDSSNQPDGYISAFKNKSAENQYMDKYDSLLKKWPVPYETGYIETEYGRTHVIKSGNKKGPSLVLLHSQSASSLVWIPNIKAFSERYHIFAFDIPGDTNKSKAKKNFNNSKESAEWLIGVTRKLGIDKFSIMGISSGSFHAMNAAIHEQQSIENLIIISPSESITKVQKKFWFWIIKVILLPFDSTYANFLTWVNADKPLSPNDYAELLMLGIKYRSSELKPLIYLFSDEELQRITMPALLLIGSKEVVTDVDEVKKRSEKLIRNLTFKIIDDGGHTISHEKSEIVNPVILDFLNKNYNKTR